MTQEEQVDVLAMRRQGKSYVEIGDELGYHPDTISGWVKRGGPPPARTVAETSRGIGPVWADRLGELLVGNAQLLATSLFEIISAEGFTGLDDVPAAGRRWREPRTPRRQRAHPARKCPELIARAPNQVWSWDIERQAPRPD